MTGNLRYLLDGPAHNKSLTDKRYLAVTGNHVDTDYNGNYNSLYLAKQFEVVRERAKNQHKVVQGQHVIFSFSKQDFDPRKSTVDQQGQQALELVSGCLSDRLPKDSQWIAIAQADNDGQEIHVHATINSVNVSGKVLNTNLVSMTGKGNLRDYADNYFENNFEKVTGRTFTPVQRDLNRLSNSKTRQMVKDGRYSWRDDLQNKVTSAMNNSTSYDDFKHRLTDSGITVKERHTKTNTGKRDALTYGFVDRDGKHRRIRDFCYKKGSASGLGTDFTPDNIKQTIKQHNRDLGLFDDDDVDSMQASLASLADDALADVADLDSSISTSLASDTKASQASAVRSRVTKSERSMQQRRRNRESQTASSAVPSHTLTKDEKEILYAASMRVNNAQGHYKSIRQKEYDQLKYNLYHPQPLSFSGNGDLDKQGTVTPSSQPNNKTKDDGLSL